MAITIQEWRRQAEQRVLDAITDPVGRAINAADNRLREFVGRNKQAIRQRRRAVKNSRKK